MVLNLHLLSVKMARFMSEVKKTPVAMFIAINPDDGSILWNFATGGIVISSPAIGSDGTIYVGSEDWNVYAIAPDGNLKWSYTTYDGIWSSPALSDDGILYIGSKDYALYALDTKTGAGLAESSWPKFPRR